MVDFSSFKLEIFLINRPIPHIFLLFFFFFSNQVFHIHSASQIFLLHTAIIIIIIIIKMPATTTNERRNIGLTSRMSAKIRKVSCQFFPKSSSNALRTKSTDGVKPSGLSRCKRIAKRVSDSIEKHCRRVSNFFFSSLSSPPRHLQHRRRL